MKYNKYDVITLDNNSKYIVCDIININNTNYLYLVNDEDDKDIIVIKENNEVLELIKDANEFEKVMLKLAVSNKNMVDEILNN